MLPDYSTAPDILVKAVPTPTVEQPRIWVGKDGWWFAEAYPTNRRFYRPLIGAAGVTREGCLQRLARKVADA